MKMIFIYRERERERERERGKEGEMERQRGREREEGKREREGGDKEKGEREKGKAEKERGEREKGEREKGKRRKKKERERGRETIQFPFLITTPYTFLKTLKINIEVHTKHNTQRHTFTSQTVLLHYYMLYFLEEIKHKNFLDLSIFH